MCYNRLLRIELLCASQPAYCPDSLKAIPGHDSPSLTGAAFFVGSVVPFRRHPVAWIVLVFRAVCVQRGRILHLSRRLKGKCAADRGRSCAPLPQTGRERLPSFSLPFELEAKLREQKTKSGFPEGKPAQKIRK